MAVPYTFATATSSIPLSQLDANFATGITLGNTTVYLGNTTTSIGNLTLTNATISSVATTFPNSFLANSSVTIGSTNISLGGTSTTLTGLTGVTSSAITDSGLTSGRVTYAGTGGLLQDSANLVFNGTQLGVGISSPDAPLSVRNPSVTGNQTVIDIIGATSATQLFGIQTNQTTDVVSLGSLYAGSLAFVTNSTERMRITSTGNVGIGTSSPNRQLTLTSDCELNSASTVYYYFGPNGANLQGFIGYNSNGNTDVGARGGYSITFNTSTSGAVSERMRIDSSGNLLVGTTTSYLSTNSFFKASGASTPALYLLKNSSSVSTDQAFCVANGLAGGTVSFQVLANGNAQNTLNSYGAISDIKLKENIIDATPKLEDLMKVKIRNYNLKADETKIKQIGVIAQELENVFPSMIEETSDSDKDGNNLGTTTKSVKYSVFVPMLIKAIQELNAKVTELEAQLESK